MIIEFTCENCGQRHKVTDEYAGRRARCKKCRHLLRVPSIFDEEFPRETTAGGSVVHRHEPRTRGFELAVGDDEALELIKGHVE